MAGQQSTKRITKKKISNREIKTRIQTFSYGEIIILGLTGSLGSGCSYIAKGIKKNLGQDCYHYELSKIIRDSLKRKGIKNPTTKQKQDEGNRLRKEKGVSVLVELCLKKIKKSGKNFNENTVILIDGIRNDGEIRCLRRFPNFYLISIHAEEEKRKLRLVGESASRKLFTAIP